MSLKETISNVDWGIVLMILGVSTLMCLLVVIGITTDNTTNLECANRKVINVVNVNKDHYRTYRVGKVTRVQRYEIEYVRVILDDHSSWEARYDDLDHDVVVGNTLSESCGKVWDKE